MRSGSGQDRRSLIAWLEKRFNLTEIFSLLTSFGLFPVELDTRRPLREAIDQALSTPQLSYARWPRVLGILSVALFVFLAVTGVMLAFYYQPTPADAYDSVVGILRDVNFGWFVHQVHGWGAELFLLILLARIGRFYLQGMYKPPREALWIVAVLTFLAAALSDFTGQLLPWDAPGYWTSLRGFEILIALPVLGPIFVFLAGGAQPEPLVLIRFYFLHVVVLPALMLILLYLNFSGVRRVGLSALPGASGPGVEAFRVYLYNLLILVVLIFGLLVSLATLLPAPFAPKADPFSTPPGSRPPWYLLAPHALYELLPSYVPRWVRGLLLEAPLAALLLLPFIDRSAGRSVRERRLAIVVGGAVFILCTILTWYAYRLETIR